MKQIKLTLYAEGLLEGSEREAIERELERDPDLRAELEAIRQTLSALEDDAAAALDEPDWEQMSEEIDAALDRTPAKRPRWRFASHVGVALVSAAAAAALTFFATRSASPEVPVEALDAPTASLAVDDWPELEALAAASPERIEVVLASLEELR